MDINFRSDIVVRLVRNWGSDSDIVADAQARNPDDVGNPDREVHILNALLKRKIVHTSPFEHSGMGVYVEAPAVVWWEWTRHRFMPQSRADHSFNLESGRYKILRPDFYLPPEDRPIKEPDGFKAMSPNHQIDKELIKSVHEIQREVFTKAWEGYQQQISLGVAREVARNVLGPAIYYFGRVSGGVLTWLHFLALRTRDDAINPSSYPQWEIEQVARKCEEEFIRLFPTVYSIFCANGRRTP